MMLSIGAALFSQAPGVNPRMGRSFKEASLLRPVDLGRDPALTVRIEIIYCFPTMVLTPF